ncbi:MAG: carbon-nitrogen family hydrolase [Thermodesulfobacteriota bacterium]
MRVTSLQLEMADRTKTQSIDYVLRLLGQAPASDLFLLPEIWPCGFLSFDRYRPESEPVDGPTVKLFKEKARERNCHILMGSFVESEGDKLFNTCLLLGPKGDIIARYRKIHLFSYQSEENKILTPGNKVVVADTPWGASGFSTCYDLRFPELYRQMLVQGAKFFLIPSAWPHTRLEAWRLFNRARAHENLAYLISCNCAGVNRDKRYAGHSMIVDPSGRIIVEGGENEEIVSADIDPARVDSYRAEFGFLKDRVL